MSEILSYRAAWTDSWCCRNCGHDHASLVDAAKCAQPQGPGWYVFAVEKGVSRQLTPAEEIVVNEFRFRRAATA